MSTKIAKWRQAGFYPNPGQKSPKKEKERKSKEKKHYMKSNAIILLETRKQLIKLIRSNNIHDSFSGVSVPPLDYEQMWI